MLSKKLVIEVLNKALQTGGDYAEIYYQDSCGKTINVDNGQVEVVETGFSTGVGIRLLKENQSVYGFTGDLSKKCLLSLADRLSKRFVGNQTLTVTELNQIRYKNRNKINRSYRDVPDSEIVNLIKEGTSEIEKYKDERVKRYIGMFNYQKNKVLVYNSKGKWFKRPSEFGRIVYQVVVQNEKGFEIGFSGPGTQSDINFFYDKLNIKKVAKETLDTALTMLDAKDCPSGKMPVVIGNGWGGVLFHEACGHPLEASSVAKGLSCFAGKVGEKVASDIVTAVDDSTIPGEWGSIDIDDEGNLGEKRILIKNGVLQDYMVDDFNGRRMNQPGNGSSRRQSFRYCPTSRMSNTYIANGKSTKEEIIKATKLGLYAVGFTGGSVDPTTGEFNFACSEAYIIRDGKICEPVKGATLIGYGKDILKQIDMVGNDLAFGQGLCGASSGSIRTNVGQPTIRLKEILVGGQGGELKA